MTWPNPAVGCVLVKNKIIVGRGFTQTGGRPHAEIVALKQAGEQARGSTAYISLEPCSFQGQSPPCTDALIKAGIARVCYAMIDPDTRVAGQGHQKLHQHSIEISAPCLEDVAADDHQGFILAKKAGRPKVTLKLAASLDGKVATRTGDSKWITSPEARTRVHLLRAKHDAVLVGKGTAETDDPMLTPRGVGAKHKPIRIILDTHLATSLESKLAQSSPVIPTWIYHQEDVPAQRRTAWATRKAKLISCPRTEDGLLDLKEVFLSLGRLGLTRVFCEGGPKLASSLFTDNLVDEFISFYAGKALGGNALSSIGPLDLDLVQMAPKFRLARIYRMGDDAVCHWRPKTR